MSAKIVKYDAIKHLLPADSVYASLHYPHDESEQIYVYFHEGDVNLEVMVDLDEPLKNLPGKYDESLYLSFIVINGNCSAKNIYNRETDGSTGLIVLGNLNADNIVVGGQEIYVTGNMECRELYWGDYNHGGLVVEGTIQAKVLMSTDYGLDFERFSSLENMKIDHLLWDEITDDGEYEESGIIDDLFLPDFVSEAHEIIDEYYSWKDRLKDHKIFEALKSGTSVIRDTIAIPTQNKDIPFFFEDYKISADNLQRFADSPILTGMAPEIGEELVLEYWDENVFYRLYTKIGEEFSTHAYIQYDQSYACLIYFYKDPGNLLKRLSGKASYSFAQAYTVLPGDKWKLIDAKAPEKYHSFLQDHWKKMLDHYSEMIWNREQFEQKITKEKIETILNLPVVKDKYSDYYSEEGDSALFYRSFQWQFRQADNEQGQCARLSILKETRNDAYEFYHFDMKETTDGRLAPILYSQHTDGFESEVYEVEVTERETFRKALHYFEILEKSIFRINNLYVENNFDDNGIT